MNTGNFTLILHIQIQVTAIGIGESKHIFKEICISIFFLIPLELNSERFLRRNGSAR